jgi:hypothetical protein
VPVTDWNISTIGGKRYLTVSVAQFRICLDDPDQGLFIAVALPLGGIGSFPALVKGDPGFPPTIMPAVDFTALENGDPTADFAQLNLITPATAIAGPVYQLVLGLHKGPAGEDGTAALDLDSYGTPLPGKILVVNDESDGMIFASQKVGDRYIPASLSPAVSNGTAGTLAVVPIPGQDNDWRPTVSGQAVVTPSGSNCRVDLIARLDGEADGNDVGRGFGISGATERIPLSDGPPAGSADSWDRVAAGDDVLVYLRAERQQGSDTFSTNQSNTRFSVKVSPIP